MAVKHIPLRQRHRTSSSFVAVIVVAVMGAASDAMDLCKCSTIPEFDVKFGEICVCRLISPKYPVQSSKIHDHQTCHQTLRSLVSVRQSAPKSSLWQDDSGSGCLCARASV